VGLVSETKIKREREISQMQQFVEKEQSFVIIQSGLFAGL